MPKADFRALDLDYWPAIQIVAAPTVTTSGPPEAAPSPLYGTNVTVEYRVSAQAISTSRTKALTKPANPKSPAEIIFEYPFPGDYRVTVEPPPTWTGYVLVVERITFWRGVPDGPSQRVACRRSDATWSIERLPG